METLINALKGTPWWVYLLFAYVLMLGIKGLKPRVISMNRLFLIPLVFLTWSIWRLIARFDGIFDIVTWVIFIVIGVAAGWGIVSRFKVRADHKKMWIRLPGSPLFLILALCLFGTKYFFGYYYSTHTEGHPVVHSIDLITSGLFTGAFVGRAVCFAKKFAKAQHEKLSKDGKKKKPRIKL